MHQESKFSLLVIGGSAGSLEVLLPVVAALKGLYIPVIIVLHRKEDLDNLLVALFAGRTNSLVKEAEDKETLQPGCIYVAPPGYHLLVEKNLTVSLDVSERVNFSLPSIDVSFESAADACGSGLMAILLSGANADGVAGLVKVHSYGGLVIVQDPATAEMPFMPQQAIAVMQPDHIIAGADLPAFINRLLAVNADSGSAVS